ncbi:hypothetical protein AB1Y20_005611 [Prymnesium parvum]|uniref:CRAL-TRIO domain-containing protein n=1 Tax=Prymnesium parvum TaxID=97485 RepID=A0AB34J6I6_PRYPA
MVLASLSLLLALHARLAQLLRRIREAQCQSEGAHSSALCSTGRLSQQAEAATPLVARLRRVWLTEIKPDFLPEVESDPLLSPPSEEALDRTLSRFVRAEAAAAATADETLRKAAARLRRTAAFRREYAVRDFYRRGMARALFMHATNAGACVYFADYGLRDRKGEVVIVGRTSLMVDDTAEGHKPADEVLPATHLRAALFVIERAAALIRTHGSMILDLSPYPAEAMRGRSRYWDSDGWVDDTAALLEGRVPSPSVGPHLPSHATLATGLPVLKEALRLMVDHYPEMLHRVWFYKPSLVFRAIFNIFRLWVPPKTREKFVLVREGEEHLHFLSRDPSDEQGCAPEELPPELGGTGEPLDGDRFLLRALTRYDED